MMKLKTWMSKILASTLSVLILFGIGFYNHSANAEVITCHQGRVSFFDFIGSEEIAHTVDALWEIYNDLNENHTSSWFEPVSAHSYIASRLLSRGVGVDRRGILVGNSGVNAVSAIAASILQCSPLFTRQIDFPGGPIDGDYELISYSGSGGIISGSQLAAAVYTFIELFKKVGYSASGTNNALCLVGYYTQAVGRDDSPDALNHFYGLHPDTRCNFRGRIEQFVQDAINFVSHVLSD